MPHSSRFLIVIGLLTLGLLAIFTIPNLKPSQASPAPAVNAPDTLTGFYGMVSFGDGCNTGGNPGGLIFNGGGGGSTFIMSGGSIHADSCITANGGVDVIVNGGNIEYGTGFVCNGGCSVSPLPTQSSELSEMTVPDFIDCSALPYQSSNGNGTISPGIYTSNVLVNGSDILFMEPGLYCFANGADFATSGGLITGNGVTIYLLSGSDLSFSGTTDINLSAPVSLPTSPNDGYLGLLIVMAEDYSGNISLGGGGNSSFTGTIYAGNPDSTIDLSGYTDDVFNLNLYGGQVTLGTSATVTINFPRNFRLHLNNTPTNNVIPGGLITYTMTISNFQSFTGIDHVILTNTLPTGTEFFSATEPYTLTGDTLTWALDYLPHKGTWQTQLVVYVPLTTTLMEIVNDQYGVRGDDAVYIPGDPVTTIVDLSVTATPSPTPSPTTTPTPSDTPTPTETASPTPTDTPTLTDTASPTPTPTDTATATPTATLTVAPPPTHSLYIPLVIMP